MPPGGAPPAKRAWLPWVLGCGGCGLLVVVAMVAFALFAVRAANDATAGRAGADSTQAAPSFGDSVDSDASVPDSAASVPDDDDDASTDATGKPMGKPTDGSAEPDERPGLREIRPIDEDSSL